MAHFIVEYRELGNPEGRAALRSSHIEYRKGLATLMPLAGPLLDDQEQPIGSIVIVEASGRAEAETIALKDPYAAGGVVALVSVRRYRIAAMKPPPA